MAGRISETAQKSSMPYTLCVFGAMWALATAHSAMGVLQTDIINEYELTEAVKGLPSGFVTGFSVLAFFVMLFAVKHLKKSTMLKAGLLTGCITFAFLRLNMPFAAYLCILALNGFTLGCVDALNSPVISELHPGKGGFMCALHAVYGVAGFVMPFVFNALLKSASSWRSVYTVIAAIEMLVCVCMFCVTRKPVNEILPNGDKRGIIQIIKEIFSVKPLIIVFPAMFTCGLYLNGVLVWAPRFMEFGLKNEQLGAIILSAVYLGIALSRIVFSIVKVNMVAVLRVLTIAAAAILALGVLIANPVIGLICVFLSAACFAPVIPFLLTVADGMITNNRFYTTVVLMLVMMAGQTAFSPIYGKAETILGSANAMYLTALMALLCWLCTMLIKRDGGKNA